MNDDHYWFIAQSPSHCFPLSHYPFAFCLLLFHPRAERFSCYSSARFHASADLLLLLTLPLAKSYLGDVKKRQIQTNQQISETWDTPKRAELHHTVSIVAEATKASISTIPEAQLPPVIQHMARCSSSTSMYVYPSRTCIFVWGNHCPAPPFPSPEASSRLDDRKGHYRGAGI